LAFLDDGPPPVYIGFGSMKDRQSEQRTAAVLEALKRSGQRGLLSQGWGGLTNADLPSDVFMIDAAPHDWLFPRVAAAIHHGGAGTTAASLRAGIPTIIAPFIADQGFWGERVYQLGVGPEPISKQNFTTERLTEAISQAVCSDTLRQNAAALGQLLRAEDGVSCAVEVLNRSLSSQ
jgi:sterol 3beta-glucosyltransferase